MDIAIETRNLTKFYGNVKAISNLNLKIPKGSFHGLVGPNGAGKTTVMKMLCGIIKPTYGSARIMGFDVEKQPEEVKKRIGYVPEDPLLYKSLTVGEFLGFLASSLNLLVVASSSLVVLFIAYMCLRFAEERFACEFEL